MKVCPRCGFEDALQVDPLVHRIVEAVAEHYEVGADDIIGPSRISDFVAPRHVAMYLVRQLTHLSLPAIGTIFERDHSTVLYAERRVKEMMEENSRFTAIIRDLSRKFVVA